MGNENIDAYDEGEGREEVKGEAYEGEKQEEDDK